MKMFFQTPKNPGDRAQAIVEFAIVLPILMALLVGILEVGRLIFTYAAVNNASREAVRYASAIGLNDSGTQLKYLDCAGIRDIARRSAFFLNLQDPDIIIEYDGGPSSTTPIATCNGNDPGIDFGNDRVRVTVKATYKPLTKLIPISDHNFESKSARTLLGLVEVASGVVNTATSVPSRTATSTKTQTPVATSTSTSPPTATYQIGVYTFTPLPTSTPTLIPSGTPTATSTETATPTVTATGTSTPSASCDTITAGNISVIDNTNVVSMTITNPYTDVTVSSITLEWNNNGAVGSPETLTLNSANVGTTFWSGLNDSSGIITLTPSISSQLILPGNNTKSTITFTFLQNYDALKMSGTTITINFSTPECSAIIKRAN